MPRNGNQNQYGGYRNQYQWHQYGQNQYQYCQYQYQYNGNPHGNGGWTKKQQKAWDRWWDQDDTGEKSREQTAAGALNAIINHTNSNIQFYEKKLETADESMKDKLQTLIARSKTEA